MVHAAGRVQIDRLEVNSWVERQARYTNLTYTMKITLQAALLTAAFASSRLVSAVPTPALTGLDLDLDEIADLPEPSPLDAAVASASVDPSTAAASVLASATPSLQAFLADGAADASSQGALRRGLSPARAPRPAGNYLPDSQYPIGKTAADFQNYALWKNNAAGATVDGFTRVYNGLKSTRGNIPGVLLITTQDSYDPSICAAKCNSNKYCASFAQWYERTPSAEPTSSNPNPDPAYWVKCLTYSYPLDPADATNDGQYAYKFYRTQAGVDFFNKNDFAPPTVAGYNAPVALPGAIFLSQADVAAKDGIDPLVSTPGPMSSIPNPAVCKKICDGITADKTYYNGVQKACNFFTLFELTKNGQSTGYQCQYYTDVFGADHALETGGYDGKGNKISVIKSWGYAVTNPTVPSAVRQSTQQVVVSRRDSTHGSSSTA